MIVHVVLVLCVVSAARSENKYCPALSDLGTAVNLNAMRAAGYNFDTNAQYFCASTAPAQFQCSCGSSGICVTELDPWGRNIGTCGCCPGWVYGLLAVFAALVLCIICLGVYGCFCRSRWWCDGFPEPILPLLPKRGPPTIVPASSPLPPNLFRGYRSEDFENEDPAVAALSTGGNMQMLAPSQLQRSVAGAQAAANDFSITLTRAVGGQSVSHRTLGAVPTTVNETTTVGATSPRMRSRLPGPGPLPAASSSDAILLQARNSISSTTAQAQPPGVADIEESSASSRSQSTATRAVVSSSVPIADDSELEEIRL